jgi:hypothetical protein
MLLSPSSKNSILYRAANLSGLVFSPVFTLHVGPHIPLSRRIVPDKQARVRHSLASQGGITRAVRAGDLTRKFAKIEHLSAFHKVLGTHNTAEAIFSAERANYRFFCFAKITFQLSL